MTDETNKDIPSQTHVNLGERMRNALSHDPSGLASIINSIDNCKFLTMDEKRKLFGFLKIENGNIIYRVKT